MSFKYLSSDRQEELDCEMEKCPEKADSILAKGNEEDKKFMIDIVSVGNYVKV